MEQIIKHVNFFCSMLPNLERIHQPNDLSRLEDIVLVVVKEEIDFPFDEIENQLKNKEFMTSNNGNIESFMDSIHEYVDPILPGLLYAKRKNLIKY